MECATMPHWDVSASNHINNNVDLGDIDDLWELISSNADPEEVGREFRLSCGGQYTSYGFLVKLK